METLKTKKVSKVLHLFNVSWFFIVKEIKIPLYDDYTSLNWT